MPHQLAAMLENESLTPDFSSCYQSDEQEQQQEEEKDKQDNYEQWKLWAKKNERKQRIKKLMIFGKSNKHRRYGLLSDVVDTEVENFMRYSACNNTRSSSSSSSFQSSTRSMSLR